MGTSFGVVEIWDKNQELIIERQGHESSYDRKKEK